MKENFIVAISHQLGCGGSAIGTRLADSLSVPFVDRQILKHAADSLHLAERDIEDYEERTSSFWQSFLRLEAFADPTTVAGVGYFPSDRELFELESKYIAQLADQGSAVILGRGGRFILRDHPRLFSVFITADLKDRVARVSRLCGVAAKDAEAIIARNDRERLAYMKTFLRQDSLDVRAYDLCVNTTSVGLENAVQMIETGLRHKFE